MTYFLESSTGTSPSPDIIMTWLLELHLQSKVHHVKAILALYCASFPSHNNKVKIQSISETGIKAISVMS